VAVATKAIIVGICGQAIEPLHVGGTLTPRLRTGPDSSQRVAGRCHMKSGDCLVIEKRNCRFDVFRLVTRDEREPIRQDIYDGGTAWLIASAQAESEGHTVYFKHEAEPDSAIRPYRSHDPAGV
jgi:hypothetical protein